MSVPVLVDRTKALLNDRKCTYKIIADITGINENWLKKFATEKSISEPSANTIEKLYNFLSGETLIS